MPDTGFNRLRQEQKQPLLQTSDNFFLPHFCTGETVLVLVLLAELLVIALVLSEPMTGGFNWGRLALCSLFVQWIVLLSAALLCLLRPYLLHLTTVWVSFYCVLLVVLLTLVFTALADYFEFHAIAAGFDLYLRHGLISLILAGLLLRYFYLQSQWRNQQQAELRSRIEALQARIKPHFLFNCLNSIASLVATNPIKAEQAVLDLSDLFRASLAAAGTLTTWAEELALTKRYLSIEQYRLGERLALDWQIDAVPDDLPIAQLTLQPLLENALIHGIQPRVEGGLVCVQASWQAGEFCLCVSNPCDEQMHPSSGTGQALRNIESRLHALFGSRASLSAQQQGESYSVCLRYPCKPFSRQGKPPQ